MDQKHLEEIKTRAEAVSAHEYNGVDDYLYAKDVKALIAKVERLTKAVKQGGINYQQKCRDIAELEAENATLKKAISEISQKLNATESQIDDKCRQWQCVLQRVYDAGSFDKNSGLWKGIDESKKEKAQSHFAAYKECLDMIMKIGNITDQAQQTQEQEAKK